MSNISRRRLHVKISNHYLEGIQLPLIEKKAAREETNIGENKTESIVGVLAGTRAGKWSNYSMFV